MNQGTTMKTYQAGIDVGSTTVKLVILDEKGDLIFGEYRRHLAQTQQTLAQLLQEARKKLGDCALKVCITGSGAINLGKALNISFVQEVVAVAAALQHAAPQTDVAIELGGEDAKIIYFTGGLEERMNGVCAGGTGSFIDQMAALLQTDAEGLNNEAKAYQRIYPIAARGGVFAKTDIRPLQGLHQPLHADHQHLPRRQEAHHRQPLRKGAGFNKQRPQGQKHGGIQAPAIVPV